MKNYEYNGFFKKHADTIAIIGVNLIIAALLISLWISQASRSDCLNSKIDSANVRMDTLHTMFYDLLREVKK